MKSILHQFITLLVCCSCLSYTSLAQDTTIRPVTDTVKIFKPKITTVTAATRNRQRISFQREKLEHRKFDSTLFTTNDTATRSDYLESLEKIFQLFSQVPAVTATFTRLPQIEAAMDMEDSALDILQDRIMTTDDRTLNIRNLQMFNTLLDELNKNVDEYNKYLEIYDRKMDEVKKNLSFMRKDTLMLHIFRDTALKVSFQPQLLQLRIKWREADSLVKLNTAVINDLKARVTQNNITIDDLTAKVDTKLKEVGTRAFGKERRYLWEPRSSGAAAGSFSRATFKKSIDSEQQLVKYYFANTRSKRFWLLLTGLVFFGWVAFNFRTLRRLNKLDVLKAFQIRYLTHWPITATLLFILSLAPLFDPHAPAIYIESTQFLLMVLLTIIFKPALPKNAFYGWCAFMLLFLLEPITRLLGLPLSLQRWVSFLQDSLSVVLGLFFVFSRKRIADTDRPKLALAAAWLYLFLNLLAVICNLAGRVTLSQIFGATAVYAFAQAISLAVFVRSVVEAFLLQIQTSRMRKKYPDSFEFGAIKKSIGRFITLVAVLLWLIVFSSNLNLYDSITDLLADFFNTPRQIGNFTTSLGHVILFLGIIWAANFLQKYIAYFFGDTGDDASMDDRGQRSKLLVTRLILLTIGFLLAVAASGLSIDRVTVILGALGVGIGLGLQSIVNNFVSGIVLIFDRPLRIGDTVEVGDKKGRVKEIGIRSSTLLTEEGAEVIIPNGDVLSHNIVNWTLSNNHIRVSLSFNIARPAKGEDLRQDTIRDLILANENVYTGRPPEILLNILNSQSMEMKVQFWCKDITKTTLTSAEVRVAIYQHLDKQGITIL